MKASTAALTALVVVANVAGNFALAWGMKHGPADAGPITSLLQPWAAVGIGVLIAWTLLRMKLLGLADLSYIVPVTAIGYVLSAVAGALWLGEHVSPQRWAGTLLVFAGAALTSLTTTRPESRS
jgi:drug/metabolite transporter (DMT)-like permease